MSRSIKKTPIFKNSNQKYRKIAKRQANIKIRRKRCYIPSGKYYKKLYNSYDIDEYVSYCPYLRFEIKYKNRLEYWKKYYLRK